MRKILLSLSILFYSIISFSQGIVPRSGVTITAQDARLAAKLNFYGPHTHGITLNGGLDSLGAMFYEDSSGHCWYRDTVLSGGHKYSMFLKSGDVIATTWGGISGTLSNQTDLQAALNTKIGLTSLAATAPLSYNNTTGVFSCPTCGTSSGGISTLNGLSAANQTFAISQTTINQPITSSGTIHTFNLPVFNSQILAGGATGNGVTDDAANIQAVLNRGGDINFPAGLTFLVNTPLTIPLSNTRIHLNGSKIIIGSSSSFGNGVISTGNTTVKYTDNSPSVNVVSGINYIIYASAASLSVGDMLLISGPQYNTVAPGGGYYLGLTSPIKAIHGDSVFLVVSADTSYAATKLQDFPLINNVSIDGGTIDISSNANAYGIEFSYATNASISKMVIKGNGAKQGLFFNEVTGGLITGCVVDSVNNLTSNSPYGVNVQGNTIEVSENTITNCNHDITSADRNFISTGIWYHDNICATYNNSLSAAIDMHGNVRKGRITNNFIRTLLSNALQVRSGHNDIIGNHIYLDNSVFNSTTTKAIILSENFNGYCNIYDNTVDCPSPATNKFAVSIEGNQNSANAIIMQNNRFNNGSSITNTQYIYNSKFNNNRLSADTLQFNDFNIVNVYNSQIQGNTTQDKTLTGTTYAINLNDSTVSGDDVSGNTFSARDKSNSIIRLTSTTTGVMTHDNYFITTNAGSPILDPSTGQQNTQWNNIKIDSFGVSTTVNYAVAPTASALFEGKTIMIASGATTTPNIAEKTGASTWVFAQVVAGTSPWSRTGNYTTLVNLTDSVAVGTATPTAPFTVQGQTNMTQINSSTAAATLTALNMTLRQTTTGGTGLNLVGNQVGFTANAGDSINNARAFATNFSNPTGIIVGAQGFYANGGTLTNLTNYTQFSAQDATVGGTLIGYGSVIAAGTNKYQLNLSGTAQSSIMGNLNLGSTTGNASAQFFGNSTTQGWKPPTMTGAQMNAISSPVSGLTVSCSDSSYDLCVWTGSIWNRERGTGGGSGTPAGSNTYVQYNNSGAFGASSTFTFASGVLTAPNLSLTSLVSGLSTDSVLTWNPTTHTVGVTSRSFSLYAANGLTSANLDSFYLGGALNQNTTIATTGFNLSVTGLPNKASALATDSIPLVDLAGKIWKLPVPSSGGLSAIPNRNILINNTGASAVPSAALMPVYYADQWAGITVGNTVDCTIGLQNLIDTVTKYGGGIIQFGVGMYKTTATLKTFPNAPIIFQGSGGPAVTSTPGFGFTKGEGASVLNNANQSDTALWILSNGSWVRDMTVIDTIAGLTSSNSGIVVDSSYTSGIRNTMVENFNQGICAHGGQFFHLDQCYSVDAHKYSYYLQSYPGLDAGSFHVTECYDFQITAGASTHAIGLEAPNGGGLVVTGCFFGGDSIGLDMPWQGFSDVFIDNNNFEDCTTKAININIQASGTGLAHAHITGNEMWPGSGYHHGICIYDTATGAQIARNIIIDHNIIDQADTGILINGKIEFSVIGGQNSFNYQVFTPVAVINPPGGPSAFPIALNFPQNIQQLSEVGGHIHFDPNFGANGQITVTTTSTPDTLDVVNAGYGGAFTLNITNTAAGNQNLYCGANVYNNAQGHGSLIYLDPGSSHITTINLIGNGFSSGAITTNINRYFTGKSVLFADANHAVNEDNTNFNYDNGSAHALNLGTITTAASAQLQMSSTTQGFLPPRMNTTQQNAIVSPATGLMIFNTDTVDYMKYTGSAWKRVGNAGGGGGSTTPVGGDQAIQYDSAGAFGGNTAFLIANYGSHNVSILGNTAASTIDGLVLGTNNAATSGIPAWSNRLRFRGNAWTGTVSHTSDWYVENQTANGADQGSLVFSYQINGATAVKMLSLTAGGFMDYNANSQTLGLVVRSTAGGNYTNLGNETISSVVQGYLSVNNTPSATAGIHFKDDGSIKLGGNAIQSRFTMYNAGTAYSIGNNALNGVLVNGAAWIYNDNSTAASTTVPSTAISAFGQATVTATNTAVTYTNAHTLYIAGPPIASTNVTITNPYSLFVNGGSTYFGGQFSVAGNEAWIPTTLIAGSRISIPAANLTDNTTAASGTLTNADLIGIGIPTMIAGNTSVTYTNAATMYIAGAPAAGANLTITNPYAVFVAAGKSYFGGAVQFPTGATNGYIWTSDANGNGTWQANPGGTTPGLQAVLTAGSTLTSTNTISLGTNNLTISGTTNSSLTLTAGTTGGTITLQSTSAAGILLNGWVNYSPGTVTDANYVVASGASVMYLPVITANRTITFPTGGNIPNNTILYIVDNNTAAFTWTFTSGTLTDAAGNSITTFKNGASYIIQYNGSGNYTALAIQYGNGAPLRYGHNISTPSTGGTVNLTNGQYNIINPSGTLVALTVNLPSSPVNGDVVYIKYTQAITTVTYGNGTVVDGITAPSAGGLVTLTFDSGTTSWY